MKRPENTNRPKSAPATQEQIVEDLIGSKLRTFYGAIESEQIPSQFLDLLDQLEQKTSKNKT
jgi:hypothetical protein